MDNNGLQRKPSIQFYFFRPLMRLARWWQWRLALMGSDALVLFRKRADWLADRLMRISKGVHAKESHLGSVPGTWLIPDDSSSEPVILFLHGGSNVFTWGSPHRRIVSYLAKYSGLAVFGVDFRLAPEHPYPAAHEDCFEAYSALSKQGKQIVLVGESSGGVLALSVMLNAIKTGLPLPVLGAFLSPLVDYDNPNLDEYADAFAHPDFVRILTQIYQAGKDPVKYTWNPLSADFSEFPPLYIMVGEKEILRGETEKLKEKAHLDGVSVEICLWPHVWHGWHVLAPQLPEATAALKTFGSTLSRLIGTE